MKIEDFDKVLLDGKSCRNILIYDILCKTLIGTKTLRVRFDKADEFIRVYDGARYLVLFWDEKYDFICNRIAYFIRVKSGITYVFSHNYAKIKDDSYHSLTLEKALSFHNVKTYIKSV